MQVKTCLKKETGFLLRMALEEILKEPIDWRKFPWEKDIISISKNFLDKLFLSMFGIDIKVDAVALQCFLGRENFGGIDLKRFKEQESAGGAKVGVAV